MLIIDCRWFWIILLRITVLHDSKWLWMILSHSSSNDVLNFRVRRYVLIVSAWRTLINLKAGIESRKWDFGNRTLGIWIENWELGAPALLPVRVLLCTYARFCVGGRAGLRAGACTAGSKEVQASISHDSVLSLNESKCFKTNWFSDWMLIGGWRWFKINSEFSIVNSQLSSKHPPVVGCTVLVFQIWEASNRKFKHVRHHLNLNDAKWICFVLCELASSLSTDM